MSSPMQRTTPECRKAEFDGDPIPLREFYDEEDNVMFVESPDALAALDFDDAIIMLQYKEDNHITFMMNLLYARKHMNNLYTLWYKEKENRNKGIYHDGSKFSTVTG